MCSGPVLTNLNDNDKEGQTVSCSVVSDSSTTLLCPRNSPGKNTRVGCHSLLQGIFLTRGWKLGLLHCRQTLYHRSHRGSPILIGKKKDSSRHWALPACQGLLQGCTCVISFNFHRKRILLSSFYTQENQGTGRLSNWAKSLSNWIWTKLACGPWFSSCLNKGLQRGKNQTFICAFPVPGTVSAQTRQRSPKVQSLGCEVRHSRF